MSDGSSSNGRSTGKDSSSCGNHDRSECNRNVGHRQSGISVGHMEADLHMSVYTSVGLCTSADPWVM